jgi:DNA polymerase-4
LEELPIRKFYGVGKVTTEKMYQLGIFTGVELKANHWNFWRNILENQGSIMLCGEFIIAR